MARHKLSKSTKGGYLLIGPHGQRLIDAIKTLPVRARSWDSKIGAWRIADEYSDEAQHIIDEVSPCE
jgi:hypothetical protein